jgi:sulfate permease, SulP family
LAIFTGRYRGLLKRALPFLRWQHRVTRETLRADLFAGLTGAALVLPQGVAFATIAGMPPEYGLYASIVPAIVAALFGSSWHLVSGPTTAASIVMYSSLSGHAIPGSEHYIVLALTLTFMVGVIQFVMGMARLGALVNFISHPVIVGFMAGAAILIVMTQVNNFLGLDIPAGEYVHETIYHAWVHSGDIDPWVSVVAVITMASIILLRLLRPRFPSMITGLLVGSVAAVFLNWFLGQAQTGIEMVGALPRQAPPLSVPSFSIDVIQTLAPVALAMTLLALTEAASIAKAISMRSGQAIDGNQEFMGQGLSNIVGSFFSSYVATGSFNRSAANYEAGARTPLAAAFAGVLLLVIILAVAPLTAYLPKAALAGILFLVAWRLIDFHFIRVIVRADRAEAVVMIVTFVSTLIFKLDFAILLGVILSLVAYLRKTSRPRITPRVPDPHSVQRKFTSDMNLPECPQLKVLRIEGSLYFGSVSHVQELLRRYREHYPQQTHLLLLTKGINQVDISGAELLAEEAAARRAMGGDLYLYRLKESASAVMDRGGYRDKIGKDNIYDSKGEAIGSIFERLDRDICMTCTKRIFWECRAVPTGDSNISSS